MIHFTWEPPPPCFFKINFNSSISNNTTRVGAGFVIHDQSLYADGGRGLSSIRCYRSSDVPLMGIRGAWDGVLCAVLNATNIILEGTLRIVISWLSELLTRCERAYPILENLRRIISTELFLLEISGTVPDRHLYAAAVAI